MSMGESVRPLSRVLRIDDVCNRFELAWKAGQRPCIREYLGDTPEPQRSALLHELIALEIDYRRQAGEHPLTEEYRTLFPSINVEQLASMLAARAAAEPGRASVASSPHTTDFFPPPTGTKRIRCPHCHNPIQLVDDRPDEVLCPACGSSFRLRDSRHTTTTDTPRPLGKFLLLARVGVGGFGAVWRARDTELDRIVALKIPHAGLLMSGAELERFHREARAAARLRHPGIVTVHEVQTLEGLPTIVSDFIEGVTLKDLLEVRPLTFREAATLLADVADALDYAHAMGLVHRDIKPANLMIEYSRPHLGDSGQEVSDRRLGRPLVMDFGLALRQEAEITLTLDGHVVGTPAYMSPEQAAGRGHRADRRSDVYSLGVILYELLTGELPFRGSKLMLLYQVQHEEPRMPRQLNDKIPRDLETICLKALAKEPARRYATARELADDLRRFLGGEPIKARPVSAWERALCWAKRRPAIAGLSLAMVLLTSLGFSLVAWQWRRAVAALQRVEQAQRAEAEEKRKAQTSYYFKSIALAHHEWLANDVGRAEQILDDCREDHRSWEWYYLKRLCHTDLRTIRLADYVFGVAFSADGSSLAAACRDGSITLWDAMTGQERGTLREHTRPVNSVAFSPDGRRLASAVGDYRTAGAMGEAKVWDTVTGQELVTFRGHGGAVRCVVFSPDGLFLASAGADKMVRVWQADTGQEVLTFRGHTDLVEAVAYSPDGHRLASAGRDGLVKVWEAAGGREVCALRGHAGSVFGLSFSPDGEWVASAGEDKTIKIWSARGGPELLSLRGHSSDIRAVAFSPDGRRLVSGGEDKTARIWDAASGQEAFILRGHTGGITAVAFSPDGRSLASAGYDKAVKLWDATASRTALTFAHADRVTCAVFSPDNRLVASASRDHSVSVWDAASARKIHSLRGHTRDVWSVAFSPDGRRLASGSWDRTVKIWDTESGRNLLTLPGDAGLVDSVAYSPGGGLVAAAVGEFGKPGVVKVWEAATGHELFTLQGHEGFVEWVAFSPDGAWLASASNDFTVKIWDVATRRQALTLRGHTKGVLGVAFSPDGRHLATASYDGTAKLWDAATVQPLLTLWGHSGPIRAVAFTRDGERLATAGDDQTIKFWDVRTGEEALTLHGHSREINTIAFSPDGWRLVSAGVDRTAKIWDATPGYPGYRASKDSH